MVQNKIQNLIRNQSAICVEQNCIGLGSTRKVYRYGNFVIKLHLNEIGFLQSLREYKIFGQMKESQFSHLFAPVYYVEDKFSIQHFFDNIPFINEQSYDIYEEKGNWVFPQLFHECMEYLDKKWDSFDVKDSSNFGLNENNELVLIDYGMSKSLYENKWVPAAEKGDVPQIEVHICDMCKTNKEIRMYGEEDQDIRCVSCGKE